MLKETYSGYRRRPHATQLTSIPRRHRVMEVPYRVQPAAYQTGNNNAVDITDATTQPLPTSRREPLLMVIDGNDERRVWVVRLLTYAEYRVYDTSTPLEAFMWWVQHPFVPQALLIGTVAPANLFFVQRLVQQIAMLSRRNVPIISLLAYLPDSAFIGVRHTPIDARGTIALLEVLWRMVARHR